MPLPAGAQAEENEGARMFREREERQAEKERKEREAAGKPKREEWMLVPPKEMDLMSCASLFFLPSLPSCHADTSSYSNRHNEAQVSRFRHRKSSDFSGEEAGRFEPLDGDTR
jgi:hypothetical protein